MTASPSKKKNNNISNVMKAHRYHLVRSSATVCHPPPTRLCFHLANERCTHFKWMQTNNQRVTKSAPSVGTNSARSTFEFLLHFSNPVSQSVFVTDIVSLDLEPTAQYVLQVIAVYHYIHYIEHNVSTPLLPKPTSAHDPELVLSTSHSHNQFP
jgi:dihydroorotate dehydrogenase